MKSGSGQLFAVISVVVLLTSATSEQRAWTGQLQPKQDIPLRPSSIDRTAPGVDDPASGAKPTDVRIRLDTHIVNVTVSITDTNGHCVTGLSKDHFEIYDNGVRQEVAHFSEDDSPVSLGIVFDVSDSMLKRLGRSVNALRRFIEMSHQDDDFFLIAFNDRAKLVSDFTTSGDQIAGDLMLVKPQGHTALYDAVYLAVEKVAQGRHTKKALLIISDGQDNNSRYGYTELRNRVQEADVAIYAIGITDPVNDSLFGNGRSALQDITRITGGRAFFPNANNEEELVDMCARIGLELRRRYSLGFYTTDSASDNSWHRVDVKLAVPKGLGRLSLSYRSGYQSFNKP